MLVLVLARAHCGRYQNMDCWDCVVYPFLVPGSLDPGPPPHHPCPGQQSARTGHFVTIYYLEYLHLQSQKYIYLYNVEFQTQKYIMFSEDATGTDGDPP